MPSGVFHSKQTRVIFDEERFGLILKYAYASQHKHMWHVFSPDRLRSISGRHKYKPTDIVQHIRQLASTHEDVPTQIETHTRTHVRTHAHTRTHTH